METSENGLSGGLSIACHSRLSWAPSAILNLTNTTVANPIRTECENGIQGLSNLVDDIRDIVEATTPLCKSDQCPEGETVVGITASIEEHSKHD